MNDKKYNRTVYLLCPTCASSLFEAKDNDPEIFECNVCLITLTKTELLEANAENINQNKKEVIDEVKKDLTKHFKNSFKKIKR